MSWLSQPVCLFVCLVDHLAYKNALTHHGFATVSIGQIILKGMSAMSYSIDPSFVHTPLKFIIQYLHSGASSSPGLTTSSDAMLACKNQ